MYTMCHPPAAREHSQLAGVPPSTTGTQPLGEHGNAVPKPSAPPASQCTWETEGELLKAQSFHRKSKKSCLCVPAPFFHWHFPGQADPVMTPLSLVIHSPDIFFHALVSHSSMQTSTQDPPYSMAHPCFFSTKYQGD